MAEYIPVKRTRRFNDITNQRFGRLVVVNYLGRRPDRRNAVIYWLCRCDCGTEKAVSVRSLKEGLTISCGCYHREVITTHGQARHGKNGTTKEYVAWRTMQTRCYTPNAAKFHLYGGRGITVCERWRHSFENFLEDMGKAPTAQHSLDRIDGDKGYEPDNCRWATATEQSRNRKCVHKIEHNGETRFISEWSDITGIPSEVLYSRLITNGWNTDRAFSTPISKQYRRD